MARKKRKPEDTSQESVIEWAKRFEQAANKLNAENYPCQELLIDPSMLLFLDKLVHNAIVSGAIPIDALLRLRLAEQVGEDENPPVLGLAMRLLRDWLRHVVPEYGHVPLPGLVKFVDGCEGASLEHADFIAWIRTGLLTLAKGIHSSGGPMVLGHLQMKILAALEGRALKKMALAAKVCGGEDNGNILYRSGALDELRKAGLVELKRGIGFYRPAAPPKDKVI